LGIVSLLYCRRDQDGDAGDDRKAAWSRVGNFRLKLHRAQAAMVADGSINAPATRPLKHGRG